jgi:hypothetical protein
MLSPFCLLNQESFGKFILPPFLKFFGCFLSYLFSDYLGLPLITTGLIWRRLESVGVDGVAPESRAGHGQAYEGRVGGLGKGVGS